MPQNLDAVINEIAGKLTKKWSDSGVATRFLSRVQNGVPAVAIIVALIHDIQANGGYADMIGGLKVGGDASLANMLGIGGDLSLDNEQIQFSIGVLLNGTNFGIQGSFSDSFNLEPLQSNLELSTDFDIGPGVKMVLTVGDIENRDGHVVKASFSFALASGIPTNGKLDGKVIVSPFIKVRAYDYQWYVEHNLTNALYEISQGNGNWANVSSRLGLSSLITKDQFSQALFESGSTADFLFDIARTAARLSPSSTGGEVKLATNYANPDSFVDRWYPGLAGLTEAGASPGAELKWSRGADGAVQIEKHYYQNVSPEGRALMSAEYAARNNLTSNAPDITTVQVFEVLRVGANGQAVVDPAGKPLSTRIVVSNFPYSANGVQGTFTNGSGEKAAVVMTYFDAATGRYETVAVNWDGHSAEQLVDKLREWASDSSVLIRGVAVGDTNTLQGVHRDLNTAGLVRRIETPGISMLSQVLEPADPGSGGSVSAEDGEIVVIGRRLPRDFEPAKDAEISRNNDGSLTITYTGSDSSTSQQTITDSSLINRINAALAAAGSPGLPDRAEYDHPMLGNAVLLSTRFQVTKNGEVLLLDSELKSERGDAATFLVFNADGTEKFQAVQVVNNVLSSTGVALQTPDSVLRKDSAGRLVTRNGFAIRDGSRTRSGESGTVYQYVSGPMAGITRIKVDSDQTPLGIQFDDAGRMLGNMLGNVIAGDNKVTQVVASAALSTIGGTLGGLANAAIAGSPTDHVNKLLESFDDEFLLSLQTKGIGAVSSYIVAQLISEIGVSGFVGDLTNEVLAEALSSAASNLLGLANNDVAFNIGNVAATVIGKKLAGLVWSPDTIGGQLGSSLGASLGASLAGKIFGNTLTKLLGSALGGPAGLLIGAFAGFLVGGLIGSIFGGTPQSGADVLWDDESGKFAIANVYAKKGGSKEIAQAIADQVASNFNSVLNATGARLSDPSRVQTGNYGMRKSDYVYRSYSTQDTSAIAKRFSGKTGGSAIANYGTFIGLTDSDFQLVGGDNYAKRALYATLRAASADTFDYSAVIGNLTTAAQYAGYLTNSAMIDSLVASEPNSVFAIEVARTLVAAVELGLNKRAASDWYGGFGAIITELGARNASQIGLYFDVSRQTGELYRVIASGTDQLADTIDIVAQDEIEAGDGNDIITIETSALNSRGVRVELGVGFIADTSGLKINGTAHAGAYTIDVAANVFAGAGDDVVHGGDLGNNIFGGVGNDSLHGGQLDDWILGGAGNDRIDAGSSSGGAGGNGNLLDGGEGDDTLIGREGSDWLEGGDGTDILSAGAGDDILAGGGGASDLLYGGSGSDQYVVRRGDGTDVVEEDATGAPLPSGTGDALTQRIARIEAWKANPNAAGALRPDWIGTSAGVQAGIVSGGEDAVVFGDGIGIGDIKVQRSGTASAPGNDLIVMVMTTSGGTETFSGTQVTIRDWFSNPFKRVEWLRFADGNEIRIGDITSFVIGGAGNDVLIGTNGNDFVYGGPGDDRLFLLPGDDVGNGGTGNDMVMGDAGRDLLIGGLGDDQLIGGAGADAITGDAGADDVYGGADRDIISGGRGDGDLVVGGAGDDTFRYARGDGRDTYIDEFANYWTVAWTRTGGWNSAAGFAQNLQTGEVTGSGGVVLRKNVGSAIAPEFEWVGRYDYDHATGTLKLFNPPADAPTLVANAGVDTIEFAPGINLQDIVLSNPAGSSDLVLTVSSENEELSTAASAGDSITIKDWYLAPGQIEKLAFYQTGILDISPSKMTLKAGTDGADGTGTSPLQGTSVNDWITGGGGDDVVAGGLGNDILAGNSGFDTLRGEAGDDVLYGGSGNDVLDGGAGKDVLVGGAGQDTASYASASGTARAQLSASWSNGGDALGDEFNGIEDLTGGSGNDNLGGDAGDNVLTGGGANDTLRGNAGDDTYVWNVGDGADVITEGSFVVEEAITAAGALAAGYTVASWAKTGTFDATSGNAYWRLQLKGPDGAIVYDNNTYSYAPSATPAVPSTDGYVQAGWLGDFSRTWGKQVTRQRFDAAAAGGADEIELGTNISLNDLNFFYNGLDLVIRYAGSSSSQITIRDQRGTNANVLVEALKFADGFSADLRSILIATSIATVQGTLGDDLLVGRWGSTAADFLAGNDGDDVLVGYAGADSLNGGVGDDTLEGGLGADLLFGEENGQVSQGQSVGDTARYVRSAAAISVDLNIYTGQGGATGSDSVGDRLFDIENVTGSAFDDKITGDGLDNRLRGLDGADTIAGGGGADVLVGDGGNDTLSGDAGEDNIAGGDGLDVLYGGSGKDVLDGGDGDDKLYGEADNDQLTGASGADYLDGADGNDVLSGGAGNDTLFGGAGNDILSGNEGNDSLGGGDGDDVFAFTRFSGADTLTDASGTNSITFDASVAFDKVWLTRVGDDLRIAVIGGDTVVAVTAFFAVNSASVVRTIQTATHAIFLDHPDTRSLITAMTAATATPAATPATLPPAVAPLLTSHWHAGGKAAPTAPSAPRVASISEDGTLTLDGAYGVVDHDQNLTGYRLKEGTGPLKGEITGFNSQTGALTYTPFADANGTDSFIVLATDADGQSVELPVTITIAALNDGPRNLTVGGSGLLEVAESAPGSATVDGTVIGRFTAFDPEGSPLSYSLIDNAGGRFTLSSTGELSVLSAALLDHDAAQSHTIRVSVSDGSEQQTAAFTVKVNNVNEAPDTPTLDSATKTVAEFVSGVSPAQIGSEIAHFVMRDPDSGTLPNLIFVPDASGNPGSRFKITGAGAQFAVNPDFEALVAAGFATSDVDGDGLREVTLTGKVQASDGFLSSAGSAAFSVRVEDVNEQHVINAAGVAASIDERDRLAAGSQRPAMVLASLSAADPDRTDQVTGQHNWKVFEGSSTTPSTRFAVDGANRLILLANQSLDFETDGASITVRVRATDRSTSPLNADRTFTFAIVNKDDVLDGTAAADTLTGQANRDILRGYAGTDTLYGLAGDDQLEGGDGDDALTGGDGADVLLGGSGNDLLAGDAGNDTLSGDDGDDRLQGGAGNDTLNGGTGNDGTRSAGSESWRGFVTAGLVGGEGDDILNGGDGDDYLEGGLGADQLNGGLGFDGISYLGSTSGVTVNLAANTASGGDAQGDVFSGIELVQGSSLGDTITGSASGNVIYGGAGNDTIRGGAGADYMFGGDGDDWIDAESGNDYLDGGAGNDTLRGGADNDTYFVGRNQGDDLVQNYDAAGTNFDHITFEGSVLYTDIWFDRVDAAGAISASGNNLKMTTLGAARTEGSVTVENWFTMPDRTLPENYFKIDLISDGNDRAALPVNVDALVALMASISAGSRPTTQTQMQALRAGNQSFSNAMEDHWGRLSAPKISDTTSLSAIEPLDNQTKTVSFAVRAWFQDDQGLGVTIPASNIDLTLVATNGYALSNYVAAVDYGTPDASGNRTVTLTLAANASTHLLPGGSLPLQLEARIRGTTRTALDPNGIALTIAATADTPWLTQLAGTNGNAGRYLPIYVGATSPDVDGSERTDVLISALPSGYVFTNASGQPVGTQEGAWWRFTAAQASNLHLYVPPSGSQDAILTVKSQSVDGSSVRDGASTTLTIKVNGAPTGLSMRGLDLAAMPHLNEYVGNETTTDGVKIGVVVPKDPDSVELSVISPDVAQLPRMGAGEERLVTVTGPLGSAVQVLETGQGATMDAGGGVGWAPGGTADTTRAYKFTIYFKPENNLNHQLYFGTYGNVQDASTGNANGNPYFWYGNSSSLVQDRWYRIEGYVLPESHALIGNDTYGGVYDTVTGDKVANTFTYRFGPGGSDTGARFFSYYGSVSGYSAQWYQPVVEKVEYTYSLDDNAGGRFTINPITGLVTANGSAFDRETAASHNITVRVTDGGGLSRTETLAIKVDNINEAPNAPGGGTTIWSFFEESGLGTNPARPGATVASFTLTDVDSTAILKFADDVNPGNWFKIVGNEVRWADNVSFDFEALKAQAYSTWDWSGDSRIEAHIANVYLVASDGQSTSAPTLLQVFITDVNERPNGPILDGSSLFSETLNGDMAHSGQLVARYKLSDPDGTTPELVITGGNGNNWFRVINGNQVVFNDGVNFTADWLRASLGQHGMDANFYYDTDGDGLKEIRVASLTLATKDAVGGGLSDGIAYNVLIEDKNETPVWSSEPFSFNLRENTGWYQHVGTVSGSDIDGPVSDLRYLFANWDWYYDGNLAKQVSRTPDQRFVVTYDGQVYVNGNQNIDFENLPSTLSYSTLLYDRALGANNSYRYGTIAINLQNQDEDFTLGSSFGTMLEGDYVPAALGGPSFNLAALMLSNIEQEQMYWSFADGSNTSGIWSIEGSTGKLFLTSGSVDYEALTTSYQTVIRWDQNTGESYEDYEQVRDLSLATQALSISVSDGPPGAADTHTRSATFTASITDKPEGPILAGTRRFIVKDDKTNGALGQLVGYDPEGGGVASYSIRLVSSAEQFPSPNSSSDIDNYANPTVTVSSTGKLSFNTPGDGEWEGGIRNHPVYGGRWAYQLVYNMAVTMTDSSGTPGPEQSFEIIFLKHDVSNVLPVILDLDGDGVEMVDADTSGVHFDMNSDGVADRTGWVGADDGLLVLDRNGNGIIDDSRELSFAKDDEQAITDLEGLRAWDSNRDGFLGTNDIEFGRFQVWRDLNQNGTSESSELFSLSSLGIRSINLTMNLTDQELVGDQNVIFATSEFHRNDGTIGTVGDVSFAYDPEDEPETVAPPIVLDLDGNGAALVSLSDSKTRFDMNGDGVADKTGWIAAGDALLALDRNANGLIDGIDEISFVKDKAGAKTDLEGLVGFDSNADGKLDGSDLRFVEFRAWRDANGNGITDAGELLSLVEAGVTSISLAGAATGQTAAAGSNIVYNTGTFGRANGTSGTLLDVGLAFTAMSKLPAISFQKSDWNGKASNYQVTGGAGAARVTPRYAKGVLSGDAGQIAAAAIVKFSDRSVGLVSTILVDLDGDGLEARSAGRSRALFDMDGDSTPDDTGWMSGGDGMLVIDRNGDGAVTHASELSFLSEKDGATSAWEGLSVLDNNRDGKIDAKDARFGELKIWADGNGDGVTQIDELKPLAALGIAEIGLRTVVSSESTKAGNNLPLSTATFKWTNGVTATIGNVAMAFDPSSTKPRRDAGSTPAVVTTPDEHAAALAASRLVQAMNNFGAGMNEGSLSSRWTERQSNVDLLAARVA
ncbi:Ig-like domain-containing protein [Sphingomonas xinjiangensis]|uniref:Ca2+-binding RTX toxin-like protein n=1 Tax=Sphingomonas xinjiangensis TaxID=643568 RepID=A0A840YSN6_9SPHN|nr:Ig-like domain-containing protein [Sphingomonas xinjiangensis]MBB5712706.1 Ca2+-binding RTX toxin-like protein [Sphingomonas xinjiangensis]